jgi:hypothetical protein
MKGEGWAGRGEGDVVSWLSKECRRRVGPKNDGITLRTSSRLLAANVILRVWAGSRQGLGRSGQTRRQVWPLATPLSRGRLSSEGAALLPWSTPCRTSTPSSPH